MLSSPGRRVLLRWMFNVLGYLLLFGSNFVVQHLLNVQYWAHTFFGSSRRG